MSNSTTMSLLMLVVIILLSLQTDPVLGASISPPAEHAHDSLIISGGSSSSIPNRLLSEEQLVVETKIKEGKTVTVPTWEDDDDDNVSTVKSDPEDVENIDSATSNKLEGAEGATPSQPLQNSQDVLSKIEDEKTIISTTADADAGEDDDNSYKTDGSIKSNDATVSIISTKGKEDFKEESIDKDNIVPIENNQIEKEDDGAATLTEGEEKGTSTTEWPVDDDDDDNVSVTQPVNSKIVQQNYGETDYIMEEEGILSDEHNNEVATGGKETNPGVYDDIQKEFNDQVEKDEEITPEEDEEEKEAPIEWPFNDDDEDIVPGQEDLSTVKVQNTTPQNNNIGDDNDSKPLQSELIEDDDEIESVEDAKGSSAAATTVVQGSGLDEDYGTKPKIVWPEDDDDNDDDNAVQEAVMPLSNEDNNEEVSDKAGQTVDIDLQEEKLDGALESFDDEEEVSNKSDQTVESNDGQEDELVDTNDGLLFSSSQPTEYHRNQSSNGDNGANDNEQGDAAKEEDTLAVANEGAGDAPQEGEDTASKNVDNSNGVDDENTNGGENNVLAVDENAVMIPNQPDPQSMWGDDEEEEDSFLDMVQSTFNVLFLAVFLTSLLVLRKRVMDRVHTNGSDVSTALKDELVDVVLRIWRAATGSGESGSNTDNASTERSNSRGNETIPLSTATDEEWGWEDEEMGTNLELSGMGDEAKEDDDLALALAMSLSESGNNGGRGGGGGGGDTSSTGTHKKSNFTSSSSSTKQPTKQQTSLPKNKLKPQRSLPKITSSTPPPSGGDSIEDLLGQMSGNNSGPMITSLGSKPKETTSKPKSTLKKKKDDSDDDIFASMGLSSIPKTKSAAPSTGGWQSNKAKAAPKSAPLPSSLHAESLDVDDDWGDDEDLDDLLDD